MSHRFDVRALRDGSDRIDHVMLDAEDANHAMALARQQGWAVLSVRRAAAEAAPGRPTLLRSTELAWWCRELRTLLKAGMTVVEALETMEAQAAAGAAMGIQSRLLGRLRQGESLSQAMEQVGGFPPVLRAGVHAAERTRSLQEALDDYLRYHEVLDQLRRKVVSAAVYPALVCAVGAVIVGFLLMGVLPRFAGVLADAPAHASGASFALLALGQWMAANTHWVAVGLVVLALSCAALIQAGVLQRGAMTAATAIPPVAQAMREFALAKLYQSLAVLYRGGYAFEQAVGHCQQSADGPLWAQRLTRCQQGLMRGEGVAHALANAELTDDVTQRLLAVGERSGSFDTVLQVIADRHSQAFADFVDRVMRIVEPVLLLLVASAVGAVVVMMYLPIFDMATGLQR